jgi:putative ABC transport system permease protein
MAVTGASVYGALNEKPAALMLPKAPRPGKRSLLEYIPFIWDSMKFTYKVTARNLFRYKRRFFMTIIGIAGCTGLMVAGFGLRDSIVAIARTQYDELERYDFNVTLKSGCAPEKFDAQISSFLGETDSWTGLHSESGFVLKDGKRLGVSIKVADEPAALHNFIALRERKTQEALPFNFFSVVLTERLAEELKLKRGDSFLLYNAAGETRTLVLSGITENYVGSFLYMGKDAWEDAFGEAAAVNSLLVKNHSEDQLNEDRLIREALASECTAELEVRSRTRQSFDNLLSSIVYVVLIIIVAAGGLAMIVLYNLTYINIAERRQELATLRVLGFHQGEAANYIFREISVLSLAGALAGLAVGIPLHRFIISVAENIDLMFGRRIAGESFILSALITMVFSGLVDLLMLGKIRKIKMAESMKAID